MATKAEIDALVKLRDEASSKLKNISKQTDKARDSLGRFTAGSRQTSMSLGSLGGVLKGLAAGAMVGFIKSTVEAANSVEEMRNLYTTAFKDMTSDAEAWAAATAAANGVAQSSIMEMQSTLFLMTNNMGLSKDAAFDVSNAMTQLTQDMASFRNLEIDVAFDKIRAGIVGESEPLKALGIIVNDTTIKQTEFAKAILETGRQLTEEEKVIARVQAIMNQTKEDQGDLVKTQASLSNQTKLLGENWKTLSETLGKSFQPVAAIVVAALNTLMTEGVKAFHGVRGALLLFGAEFIELLESKLPGATAKFLDVMALLPGTLGEVATSAADSLRNMELSGETLADSLREKAAEAFMLVTATAEENVGAMEVVNKTYEDVTATLENYESATQSAEGAVRAATMQLQDLAVPLEMTRRRTVDMTTATEDYDRRMSDAEEKTKKAKVEVASLGDTFGTARGLLTTFGVSADSTFGKILGWADKLFGAFDKLFGKSGLFGTIGSIFGGGGGIGGGGGGLGGLLGGIGSLFGGGGTGFGAAAAGIGTGGLGVGTAATGAGVGGLGGLGGALAGLATNPFTIAIAGAVAAALGLKGLFGRKANAGEEFDESGRRFGAFGGVVSEGTRAHIENLRSQTNNDSIQGAFSLGLGAIIKDALSNGFTDIELILTRTGDIFSSLERGEIGQDQTAAALKDAVGELLAGVGGVGGLGEETRDEVERIVAAAERFGVAFEGLDALKAFVGQGGPGAAGQTVSNSTSNEITVNLNAGVVAIDKNELAGTLADAMTVVARDQLGGFNGAVERNLEGTFERSNG